MKVTLKQIKDSQQTLNKVLAQPLSVQTAYRIRKLAKPLKEELANIEEVRFDLIKKFGEKIKKTGSYQVPVKKINDFMKEFNEFLETETDLGDVELIKLVDLENMKLSVNELISFEYLLMEDEPVKPVKPAKVKKPRKKVKK